MAHLRIETLAKQFRGHSVLSCIDLAVGSGEVLAVLGASGSGKTTMLRLLAGFDEADAGSIFIDGRQICGSGIHVPPERRRIGYVAQEGALFPHVSVAENVTFGLSLPERRDGRKAAALLESVGLKASYGSRAPHELSGGEQQRVALARALAPAPRLVLLDEPFSALDPRSRAETRQAVVDALRNAAATALLVTHDQSEALSTGDRVAVLRRGRLAQVATPTELYRNPIDADLARFVGDAVLIPGWAENGVVNCALGSLPLASGSPDGPVDVMMRPEQIRITSDHTPNSTEARVLTATYFGHEARVLLAVGQHVEPIMTRVSGYAMPQPGSQVWLQVEAAVMAYPQRAMNSALA